MEHPKVVNSAYFSPRSGTKILTTCIDKRFDCADDTKPRQEIDGHADSYRACQLHVRHDGEGLFWAALQVSGLG
jgi:hypothetical protein